MLGGEGAKSFAHRFAGVSQFGKGCSRGLLLCVPVNHPKAAGAAPRALLTHFSALASPGGVCHICTNPAAWQPAQFPAGPGLKDRQRFRQAALRDLPESGLSRGREINLQERWHEGFHRLKSRTAQITSRTSHIKSRTSQIRSSTSQNTASTSQIKGQDFTEQAQDFTDQI